MKRARKSIAIVALGVICGCGARPLATGDDASSTPQDSQTAPVCQYPQGTCNFDFDCAEGHRCVGAVRTAGEPPELPCQGICEPIACQEPPGLNVWVSLEQQGGQEVARLHNVGCKTIYVLQGCCGEGTPRIEQWQQNSWVPASCVSPTPGICCDAEPSCVAIAQGESIDIPAPATNCCGSGHQLSVTYYRDPACASTSEVPFVASTPYQSTCQGGTACGTDTCDSATEVCVQREAWGTTHACEPVPAQCLGQRDCSCLADICGGSGNICVDSPLSNTISCNCIVC